MKPRFLTHARSLLAITLILTQLGLASGVGAQVLPPQNPSQFDMTGFIQAATLDPTCTSTDVLCGGTITVNNQVVIVPRNTILQMPPAALTWQRSSPMRRPPTVSPATRASQVPCRRPAWRGGTSRNPWGRMRSASWATAWVICTSPG